jgi:hypothetical protein
MPWGYEVEVRIPFKSLKYQAQGAQAWGINVTRFVQHSGYEDSWAPAQRANTSFLAQSGTLVGLNDLRRGLVLDLAPEVTDRADGLPRASDGRWNYHTRAPDLGANVRWGVTNNFTLNGTVNPDFSQVEADAGQFSFDPRQALSFPEKRPFFLDGIEQFSTPNGLVYTRRVVQPAAAVKLTGKVGSTNVGLLSAVDDNIASTTGRDHPLFNILRVTRDFGEQGTVGMLYTDRIDGDNSNRVLNFDTRFVRNKIYSASLQVAESRTVRDGVTTTGPLWDLRLASNGRAFGVTTLLNGIDPGFLTQSGFISRGGQVHANISPRYTFFFPSGARVENITPNIIVDGLWFYDNFFQRGDARDKKLHFNVDANLRGGWNAGLALLLETFDHDPGYYGSLYRVARPRPGGGIDTLPFTGTPAEPRLRHAAELAAIQVFLGQPPVPVGAGRELLRVVVGRHHLHVGRAERACLGAAAAERHVPAAGVRPQGRRRHGGDAPQPAPQGRVSADTRALCAGDRRILHREGARPARRGPHGVSAAAEQRQHLGAGHRLLRQLVPRRLAGELPAPAGHGVLRRLRRADDRA